MAGCTGLRRSRGFALLLVLGFLALLMLVISALLSASQGVVGATADAGAAMRLRSAVHSGIDYAELQLRNRDFTSLLTGANGVPDTDWRLAAQIRFRSPLNRVLIAQTAWQDLRYLDADDGLLYEGAAVLNPAGLLLNQCKLFFKVTNNPDDPGGPFRDTDDIVLLRVAAVTPAATAFMGHRSLRNFSEFVEVQLRRSTTFLGPAAIYCPSGRLVVDLGAGGVVSGRAEVGDGAAIAVGGPLPQVSLASSDQLDGNPPVLDLSGVLASDMRLRWLADQAFVNHWKAGIGNYAGSDDADSPLPGLHWAPAGLEISAGTVRGVLFSAGPVILRGQARLEGLLVLIDSGSLRLEDSASLSGGIAATGEEATFTVLLSGNARVEYRPSQILEALRLLPLSHTSFRYITPEMEM